MKNMFVALLIVCGPLGAVSHCQSNLGGLQVAFNSLGYSINASTDILGGDLYFQRNQSNASIMYYESSLHRGTAFGWYEGLGTENWLIGGSLTGLAPSALLPDIDGVFGFNIWTNYNGQERPEMDAKWYSQATLNRDGADHLFAYRTSVNGQLVANSYILAWEDWNDWDYQDIIVRVDGVQITDGNGNPVDPGQGEVPEPSSVFLLVAGLSACLVYFKVVATNGK